MVCPTLQRLLELERDAWFGQKDHKDREGIKMWEVYSLRISAMFGGGDTPDGLLLEQAESELEEDLRERLGSTGYVEFKDKP